MIETDIIILKTFPYQESSIITQALSENFGRISIIAKGARKLNRRTFPNIGLFRVLTAQLTPPKNGDLYTLKNAELKVINDNIAGYPDLVDFASTIANFSLCSNFNGVPCPLYHHSLQECLNNIQSRTLPFAAWTCRLLICHLMEQGLFPEMNFSAEQQKIIQALLDQNYIAVKDLSIKDKQWQELLVWVVQIAKYAEIELPQSPLFLTC
jgi:recombinational DNA repair protein (RecF pathway)